MINKNEKPSINKILSIIALALSIISIIYGGIFAEIVALIIAIVVLITKEHCEPEARKISKIALIISVILILIRIVLLILLGLKVLY